MKVSIFSLNTDTLSETPIFYYLLKIGVLCYNQKMIYVIRNGSEPLIKIGYTADERTLKQRLARLQIGNPHQLVIAATFGGDESHEKEIQSKLVDFFVRGEWFEETSEAWQCLANHAMASRAAITSDDEIGDKVCDYCGKPLPKVSPKTRRFCGNRCRGASYRKSK